MELQSQRDFANGSVFALMTKDGYPIEVTDTFLPFYTKDAVGRKQNNLRSHDLGDRSQRWMIGVSCMSGCPVRCKFCATGQLKRWRSLSAQEIVEQVEFVIGRNPNYKFEDALEHKINYTRMGEPFLNIAAVREAIELIDRKYPRTHHYVSTIGVRGSGFSWVKDNITLQVSLHSLNDARRDDLIPVRKLSIEELGQIRTGSALKTTVNMTLVDRVDFDARRLRECFDPEAFFIKLSPINTNPCSDENAMGNGVVDGVNLL